MASDAALRVCRVLVAATAVVSLLQCSGSRSSEAATNAPPDPVDGLAVFPGAEGFGTRTRAGRGGKAVAVTSLADSGPGTLREALQDSAPKTIVFRVGGVIQL
jgi:hypothetical protein